MQDTPIIAPFQEISTSIPSEICANPAGFWRGKFDKLQKLEWKAEGFSDSPEVSCADSPESAAGLKAAVPPAAIFLSAMREIWKRESVGQLRFPTPFLTPYDDKMVSLQDFLLGDPPETRPQVGQLPTPAFRVLGAEVTESFQ